MLDKIQAPIDIYDSLHKANIKYKGKANHKGWLSILCPFHDDKHFGSCSINVNTGVISCWVCGNHHINHLLNDNSQINFTYTEQQQQEERITPSKLTEKMHYNFVHMKFNPDDFHYTKQRGFTQEFVDHFNIVRCFSEPYRDYFCIPIIDKNKNIYECEFRKLMAYEYQNDNSMQYYLNDKKVKYEKGSRIKETIWNIDNLNKNTVLYLCEGIGSMAKLWAYNKNSTCTFGAQISDYQIKYLQQFPLIRMIPDWDKAGFESVDKLRKYIDNLQIIDIGEMEDTDDNFILEISDTNNIIIPKEYIDRYMIKYNVKGLY